MDDLSWRKIVKVRYAFQDIPGQADWIDCQLWTISIHQVLQISLTQLKTQKDELRRFLRAVIADDIRMKVSLYQAICFVLCSF